MAQNISVTLVLDDRQYTAKLKTAEAATQSFAKSAENGAIAATTAFGKLNVGTDGLVRRIGGLRTALAGLGFAAVGGSALAMADDLQDLSNASGISVARLLELRDALATSGGQADQMSTAINNFLRTIDEAAQGNIKTQKTFKSLGVSIDELRRLSEEDLFTETLKGIAAVTDKSRQSALMMEYFGKSFKTVDPQELLDKLRATRGEGDRYAVSIKRAAELNDALARAQGTLRLAFIEAFSPVIKLINDFNQKTEEGTSKFNTLVTAIKIVGSILAAALAASVITPIIAAIGTLLRGISAIGVALGATALPAWLIASTGAAARFLPILRAIGLLFSAGLGIYTATQLFDNLGDVAANALARIVEGIGQFAGQLLNLPTDIIGKMLGIDNPVGLGSGLLKMVQMAREAREKVEAETANKKVKPEDPTKPAGPTGRPVPDAQAEKELLLRRKLAEALNDQRVQYMLLEDSQRTASNYLLSDLQTQTERLNLSEDQRELQDALNQETNRYLRERNSLSDKLREVQSKITFEQRNQYGLKEDDLRASNDKIELLSAEEERIRNLIGLYYDLHMQNGRAITNEIQAQQRIKNAEKERAALIEYNTQLIEQQYSSVQNLEETLRRINDQRIDLKFEAGQIGKGNIEKQFVNIQESARKAAMEAGRAFAATFDTSGDALTPERAQELADGLAKIAEAYRGIADAQIANLEASRTWEAGWREAFANYAENAKNAADQARSYFETFTKGFEDLIVSLVTNGKFSFKDFANSIIAEFARIQARKILTGFMSGGGAGGGGSILDSIFKFGKGLFGMAAGGPTDMSPMIVGERGPEMFVPRSAGRIIPNNALGGGGTMQNLTTVNYNIQAVDASSFRTLLAKDPQFIYAVTEKGRRSQPQRSRV